VSRLTACSDSNTGLDLVINSGSAPVGIGCSGTTEQSPGDLTCSAGGEQASIVFEIPKAGSYRACVAFSSRYEVGSGGGIQQTFQIIQTPNNAQTILQEGKDRTQTLIDENQFVFWPWYKCGTFLFSSTGKKTLRLMFEQDITTPISNNLIIADRNASYGQRDIHWTVYPLTNNFPQAVALANIDPTHMTNEGATKAGYKQYLCDESGGSNDIAYNNGIKATLSGTNLDSVFRCALIPYQMQGGEWRLRLNVRMDYTSSSTSQNFTVNGTTVKNVAGYYQSCTGSRTGPPPYDVHGGPTPGGADLNGTYYGAAAFDEMGVTCDIELDSKPTWAY
jgi:hypothetical protein